MSRFRLKNATSKEKQSVQDRTGEDEIYQERTPEQKAGRAIIQSRKKLWNGKCEKGKRRLSHFGGETTSDRTLEDITKPTRKLIGHKKIQAFSARTEGVHSREGKEERPKPAYIRQ